MEVSTRSRNYDIMDYIMGGTLWNIQPTSHFAVEFLASF